MAAFKKQNCWYSFFQYDDQKRFQVYPKYNMDVEFAQYRHTMIYLYLFSGIFARNDHVYAIVLYFGFYEKTIFPDIPGYSNFLVQWTGASAE
ncbi:hypothetical protein AB6805_17650 [Chitinophaga sp. RCC_12]|uniref:hypothetical protein n=1 Tax=Chitinophaga sp. RCC_12 TaxID=3239226 RepID=UPI0035247309